MRILTAVCLALAFNMCTHADCPAPQYRLGAVWVDSKSDLIENISIPLRDFIPSKLVCLAGILKEKHPDRSHLVVNIFSSHKAARYSMGFLIHEYTGEDVQMIAQMHAEYIFDAERHENYVELIPISTIHLADFPKREPYDTRIDLPVSATPQCHLEMNGRCLITLDSVGYPAEALKVHVSGTVTLAGTITRGGSMKDVRLSDADVTPSASKDLLVNDALLNLKTWRLEPGQREDPVHIVYSYRIVNPPVVGGTVRVRFEPPNVQFELPNEIVIEGKSVK